MTAVQIAERILFGPTKTAPAAPVTDNESGLSQGEMLALAQHSCTSCLGLGTVPVRGGRTRPCLCVWRGVFRLCYARFRGIVTGSHYVTTGALQPRESRTQNKPNSSKQRINEEYAADFYLLSKRTLRANPLGWKIFRFHFLLGADWKLCAAKLGIERGAFFHEVYRVQQALGRAYAETLPYGIYPLDEYFGGTFRGTVTPISADSLSSPTLSADRTERNRQPLRAPLQRAA